MNEPQRMKVAIQTVIQEMMDRVMNRVLVQDPFIVEDHHSRRPLYAALVPDEIFKGAHFAHPVAPVFVIVCHGCPRPRQAGLPSLLHQLLAGLVQAHQHFMLLELTMIDLQHVLHGAYKVGAAFWRNAPAFFQPRLQLVFFRVRRTVSVLMLSTISSSTS